MFNTEDFIAEVEKRPAIYDLHSEEYNDRAAKARAWDEVCEIMIPKWHALSELDKNTEERILRGKWRNIRDYFMKELKHQSPKKNGSGKKRKRYMYFDRLLFLMSNVEQKRIKVGKNGRGARYKDTTHLQNCFDVKAEEGDYEMHLVRDDLSDDYVNSVDDNPSYRYMTAAQAICETAMAPTPDNLPDAISMANGSDCSQRYSKYNDEDDYDKMFLLSLLPIMRRIPEDKKLDVRMQMQQSLAQVLKSSSTVNN